MTDHHKREPDALETHPQLRDTQEFQRDILAREASTEAPGSGTAGAVGGAGGALAGAGLGTLAAGPVGAIVGALAGALGGWWAGRAAADAPPVMPADDAGYRAMYEGSTDRVDDRSYEDVRPLYHLGHVASAHPDYRGRSFEEIEADLQKGWTDDLRTRYGDWAQVRPYAREAYGRRLRDRTERKF
jgi:hypothetical protein